MLPLAGRGRGTRGRRHACLTCRVVVTHAVAVAEAAEAADGPNTDKGAKERSDVAAAEVAHLAAPQMGRGRRKTSLLATALTASFLVVCDRWEHRVFIT